MHDSQGRDPNRLFPADPVARGIASELYAAIADAPIISPHGHVPAEMLLADQPFADPADLFVTRDHYVTRMLHAAGHDLGDLRVSGSTVDPRHAWRVLCSEWHRFAGTASGFWIEESLAEVLGIHTPLSADAADDALWEARGIFSPVRIASTPAEALEGFVEIRSRRWFADLSDLVLAARVENRDGATAEVARDAASLAAGETRRFALPDELREALSAEGALALSVVVRTTRDEAWAPAGTELSVHQVVLDRAPIPLPTTGSLPEVDARGAVAHALLHEAPRLSLWRAITDNDASFSLDPRFVATGFFALEPVEVSVATEDDAVVVTSVLRAAFGDEVRHTRRIREGLDGEWIFDERVELPEGTTDGLRVGMEFTLPVDSEDVTWTGLGPFENYPDRRSSAVLGTWSSTIDDLAVPYLKPQSNRTRGGVDDAVLTGPAGAVCIRSAEPMHLTVSRFTTDELENATHWWKLPESTGTVVHVDVAHRGVGTALLGPDTRKPFRLADTEYAWTWSLQLTQA